MSMLMTLPKPGEHSKTPLHQAAHKRQGADASAFMAAPNGAKVQGRWRQHGDDFFIYFFYFSYYYFIFLFVFHVFKENKDE